MKYEKHVVRVTKGNDFIMIDLLSPDGKTTTSTEPLGTIVLKEFLVIVIQANNEPTRNDNRRPSS